MDIFGKLIPKYLFMFPNKESTGRGNKENSACKSHTSHVGIKMPLRSEADSNIFLTGLVILVLMN